MKQKQTMEDMQALAKVRSYSYIIFILDLLLLAHAPVARLIGIGEQRLSVTLILLVVFQTVVCMVYHKRYADSVSSRNKSYASIQRYVSYLRMEFTGILLLAIAYTYNTQYLQNYYLGKAFIAALILLLFMELRHLTILQRREY